MSSEQLVRNCAPTLAGIKTGSLYTLYISSEEDYRQDIAAFNRSMNRKGLLEYKDKHPMALSGGQKQRVAVACAIASGAKLLLFDEPTSGLDMAHMRKVGQMLQDLAKGGSTVLVVTHDPELIEESCDFILKIENGKAESLMRK